MIDSFERKSPRPISAMLTRFLYFRMTVRPDGTGRFLKNFCRIAIRPTIPMERAHKNFWLKIVFEIALNEKKNLITDFLFVLNIKTLDKWQICAVSHFDVIEANYAVTQPIFLRTSILDDGRSFRLQSLYI